MIRLEAIGVVRSPYHKLVGMPLQPVAAADTQSTVELRSEFAEGLSDLEGFSHLFLITWLHRAPRAGALRTVPYLDSKPRGVFATRSPQRPNPIGLSVVRLAGIDGPRVRVVGADLLNGTPVLDIKPYVPAFDHVSAERTGWLAEAAERVHTLRSDDRFDEP